MPKLTQGSNGSRDNLQPFAAKPSERAEALPRNRRALVLAGGGVAGAVYEIGALRAINDLLNGVSVNDFDIYVGTSAGSIVASGLAHGLTPQALLQAIEGTHGTLRPIRRRDIFSFNTREFMRRSLNFPSTLRHAITHYWQHPNDFTLVDLAWVMAEILPSALYDGQALAQYITELLRAENYDNTFSSLNKELYIIATDLNTGQRAVFGSGRYGDYQEAPVSLAVAASCAVPMLYKPIRIGESEYVDGGLGGNASLDLAIERGAKLVVCINPLVPYSNASELAPDPGFISDRGMQAVVDQVLRIMLHSGLRYHIKQLRRRHPDVDIILIEPSAVESRRMYASHVMRYSERINVARQGYESVTLDLAKDYHYYKDTLSRHGIDMSARSVIPRLERMEESGYAAEVVRDVLELHTPEQSNVSLYDRLNQALSDLDDALDRLA